MTRPRTDAAWLALLLGFLSIAGQVIVIRELLVASTGNELTVAVTLAVWIAAVAAGSRLAGCLPPARRASPAALVIISAFALPFQVVLIRAVDPLVSGFGQMIGPGAALALAAAGVLPAAPISGALFVSLVARLGAVDARRPIQVIYGLEAVGAGAAGLALSIYLMEWLNPIALASVTGAVGIGAVAALSRGRPAGRARPALVLAAALVLVAMLAANGWVNRVTRQWQWGPLAIRQVAESRYGSIVVARHGGTDEVFETGALVSSLSDRLLAEETAHLPLLHHPHPRRVLLAGGAVCGAAAEVVRHPSVEALDWAEIDPVLVSTARAFAPADWFGQGSGADVRGLFVDPRRFVAGAGRTYDVIIVGAGSPTTLQANRYYTVEFFRSAAAVLAADGLLALKIPSPGAYAGPEVARLASGIAGACRRVFAEVQVLPGEYIHVLASPRLDVAAQTGEVSRRLRERGIAASFVNEYVLWDRLSPARLSELDSVLARYDTGEVNSDLDPVAFAASMAIWQKTFGWRVISRLGRGLGIWSAAALLLAIGVVVALGLAPASGGGRAFPDLLTIYAVGVASMATEVLAVLGLQTASGYVYGRVAVLIAAFMVGMGVAAMLSPAGGRRGLSGAWVPALLALPPLAVAPLIASGGGGGAAARLAVEWGFPVLAFLAGGVGGLVFAATAAPLAARAGDLSRAASAAYVADLAGACVAGFATALVLVPALGLAGTGYAVAASCLAAPAVAVICRRLLPAPRPR